MNDAMSERDSSTIGRKAFLTGSFVSVLGLAAGRVRLATAGPVGSEPALSAFMLWSHAASGASELPGHLARPYFTALEADGALKLKPAFARLAGVTGTSGHSALSESERSGAFRATGGRECLDAIASVWWSGIVPVAGGGQRVVNFADALVTVALKPGAFIYICTVPVLAAAE